MDPSPRPHRDTLAIVLTILGGAVWLSAPLAVVELSRATIPLAIIAGCAVGAGCIASMQPGRSPGTAVVAGVLAALIARGGLVLWHQAAAALGPRDLLLVTAAGVAAGLGAFVGRQWPKSWMLVAVAGMVSLAVVTGGFLLLGVAARMGLGTTEAVLLGGLAAPVVGGAITAAMFPQAGPAVVAVSWVVLGAVTSLAIGVADGSAGLAIGGALLTVLLAGVPASLGAIGAWIYRAIWPPPLVLPSGMLAAELPRARVLE